MNGQWRMETEDWKEESGIFSISGPAYLKKVDWRNPNHTRSIMASLVQGVYMLERDRQQKRTGDKALSPPWSNFFQFQCIKTLIDQIDHSIFGAIFEYKPHAPYQQGVPPGRYIIVFRGTILEPATRTRDIYLDTLIGLDCGLTQDSRYQIAFQEINAMLSKVGPRDVVLAGHSLGAAIALQAGKEKAKMGCLVESYLFNPPFPFWDDEKADDPYLKSKTAGLYLAKKGSRDDNKTQQHDYSFKSLCSWIPNLFANPGDPISSGYIWYFENRDKMKELRSEKVDRIASKNSSLMTMLPGAFGREGEPSYVIPSALLTKNMDPTEQSFMQAHALHQWWKQHVPLQTKLYKCGQC